MAMGGLMTYGILVHLAPLLNLKEMFSGVGCAIMIFGLLCLYALFDHLQVIHNHFARLDQNAE